jgi:hypothetical protein
LRHSEELNENKMWALFTVEIIRSALYAKSSPSRVIDESGQSQPQVAFKAHSTAKLVSEFV